MTDVGFKVSKPGVDVRTAAIKDLVVDSNYPVAKCDLRVNPKNYGIINFLIGNLPNGASVTVYQQAHTYTYIPSFLTAWNYPVGTSTSAPSINSTFGIGNIDAVADSGPLIEMYCDAVNFNVVASNSSGGTLQGINGTIRFYIFADDFSDT